MAKSKSKSRKENGGGISADDLAVIAAVLVVIGDLVALWAVLAARNEAQEEEALASLSSRKTRKRRRG